MRFRPTQPPENPAMSSTRNAKSAEQMREEILQAAFARFSQYGFGKTTMAEIAGDCQMSAANLYRFFASKQDMGVALACQCLGEKEQRLRHVIDRPGMTASERLLAFMLELYSYMHELLDRQPRVNELVEAMAAERMEVIKAHNDLLRSLLVVILQQGRDAGEFDIEDVTAVAETVMAATKMFHTPYFLTWYKKDEFVRLVHSVVDLLIRGLARR
jgi:AcrR family transcriptional regulator